MKNLTLEEHRARIEAVRAAADNCRGYLSRHRIGEYLAGQCIYSIGDYPAKFSIEPTDYDYNTLKSLAENGVQLIQIHEEWNDSVRHFGADKYSTFDPAGMKHFVELCHFFGIKIIPYISSGYFHIYDPDFRDEFSLNPNANCVGMHFHYRCCSSGSPAWREYVLPRTFRVLDTYEFDGIYNDWGYDGGAYARLMAKQNGGDPAAPVTYDPEEEDLLSTIYTEVKARGGVYKLHCDGNRRPPVKDKVYDYLWIGEGIRDTAIGVGKDYPPYVVPCQDKRSHNSVSSERYFAMTIPFLQFPLLTYGRPLLGCNIHENIPYYGTENPNSEYNYNRQVEEYMKDHPNGPYVYSLWSAIPDDVEDYPRWCRYFALYKPMVEPNSIAYIDLSDCADIASALPENVFASMFVNEKRYLVVSNLSGGDYALTLSEPWTDRVSGQTAQSFTIPDGKLLFLVK